MNPLEDAKRRAADQLEHLLASQPDDPDLATRLEDLVMAAIHQGTEGFHRRDPRAAADPRLDPTWIPTLPAETVDRLAAARLAQWDEEERQWVWTSEWLVGLLALRAFRRGDPGQAEERLQSGLLHARTLGAEAAFCLLADEWIRDGQVERLTTLFETDNGLSGLAGALALRAPAGAGAEVAADLEAFTELLDRLLGPSRALQPAAASLRVAKVLDRAAVRLHGHDELEAARRLLLRRLTFALERAAELQPREVSYLKSLAKACLGSARAEEQPVRALEDCARALDAWRRFGERAPEDPWIPGFLHRLCGFLIDVPRQGDPARFHEVYAAALEALAGSPPDESTREASLRQQIMLMAWSIDLQWEATPGETLTLFERGLPLIDQLLELCPDDLDYLKGKQKFLEEFANYLDAREPERAKALREECRRVSERLAANDATAKDSPVPEAQPAAAAAPLGEGQPAADEEGRPLQELRGKIRTALDCAREDPVRAIAVSAEIIEAICRGVLVREMGPPPGHPTFPQVVSWIRASGRLPERLNFVFIILDWHKDLDLEELTRSSVIGSAPGVYCCAAMARLARWYFGEYLQVEVPPEIADDKPGASLAAPERRRPILVPAGGETSSRPSVQRPSKGPALRAVPGLATPGSAGLDLAAEESRLHPAQLEAARKLGVPFKVEDPHTGIVMVLVPGGTIRMETLPTTGEEANRGRPHPIVEVRIRPFYCGIAPVRQEEWSRLMERNPSLDLGARLPVANLAWEDVQAFLERANQDRTGPPLRLPLAPEWELAARGGCATAYWWGNDYRSGWANCSDDGPGSGLQGTSEPGRFPANPYSLLDVLGNVREWCHGARLPDPLGATPFGASREPVADDRRVMCGGSWQSFPTAITPSERAEGGPKRYHGDVGFRCVRDVGGTGL